MTTKTFTRADFDTFIGSLKHTPNKFQLATLEELAFGNSNVVISALAGSGKTSLIVMAVQLLKAMGVPGSEVLVLAFNVKIREELNKRLPAGYVAVNSHSLGLQVCKQGHPKARRDANKWFTLVKDVVEEMEVDRGDEYPLRRKIQALCSKVMLNHVDPENIGEVLDIAAQYHIEDVEPPVVKAVAKCIRKARRIFEDTGALDFDEMLYLPVVMDLQPPKVKFVFVDEAQDLNVLQQEIASRSCADDARMVIVGDAKQAIYMFAGADAASFEKFKTMRPNTKVLPLNICYRCPTSHLDLARRLVPEIEARPDAPVGEIRFAGKDALSLLAKAGDLVMSRTNAPLLGAYFDLIKKKIPAKVIGREIGKDLANTLDKIAQLEGFSYHKMVTYIERYREMQTKQLQQKPNSEAKIEELDDKMDCLSTCAMNFTECHSLDDLKKALEALFTDESSDDWRNSVALCSVHRAKGLEADNTFILNPEKMPLMWEKQSPAEFQQELNIKYVALTRALKSMTFLSDQQENEVRAGLGSVPVMKIEDGVAPKFIDLPTAQEQAIVAETTVPQPVAEKPAPQPVTMFPKQILCKDCGDNPVSAEGETCGRCKKIYKAHEKPADQPQPAPKDDPLRQIASSLTDTELDKLIALLVAIKEERKSA